jgi:CRP-like cAMP-binding protein
MKATTKAEAERIVSATGWLSLQPASFRAAVLSRAEVLHFVAGETIYRSGDPLGGIFGVVDGTMSVTSSPRDAAPILMHLGIPGMWTGEGCFFTRQPRRIGLRALVDTCMMHLPLEAMDQMAARDPNTVRNFAQILMTNVDTLLRIVHDLQQRDADRRIAAVLWRISAGGGPIPLSQTELGIIANASRKQVNAALKAFEASGWVANGYRSIAITGGADLRKFAASAEAS